jgi:hypothetical protein
MKFDVSRMKLVLDLFGVFLGELFALLVELVSLSHLILDGGVVILPVETEVALHVVQGWIGGGLRKPTYILRRCRLVPFLSRNISMLYCTLLLYNESEHPSQESYGHWESL